MIHISNRAERKAALLEALLKLLPTLLFQTSIPHAPFAPCNTDQQVVSSDIPSYNPQPNLTCQFISYPFALCFTVLYPLLQPHILSTRQCYTFSLVSLHICLLVSSFHYPSVEPTSTKARAIMQIYLTMFGKAL